MNPRRLPVVGGKEVVRALRRAGFELRHVHGSHHVLTHTGPPRRMVSVPVHGSRQIPVGTLSAILEEAGLSADEFIALL
ncbi:type II toxin-antitoxin system HicA family toxin [Mesorhizobium sp. ASY16-5R]|uniref:type II toxin-antitoxin system HicA family toxin n=1 Tax=Mesorhizobium sp. ASY16-5R TaxID=3445772 RepID=UPI003FA0DBD7